MSDLKSPGTLSNLEVTSIAHIMADAYWRALKAEAQGRVGALRHALRDKEQLLDTTPSSLEWHDLSYAEQDEPGAAAEVYAHIKQAARDHLENGERAAEVVAHELSRPWIRARYLALRESFIADWKPTGSIELRLIEMMADRFNRLFLRTLRQLRDLRRYNLPVMINNPQQVNIAADGGQQVNVQKKARSKKAKA